MSPHPKLIFLTMNPDPDLAAAALRVGASGYLLKTSAASELTNTIRDALGGLKYITPAMKRELRTFLWSTSPCRYSTASML